MLSKAVSSAIFFLVFGMTRPEIEPWSLGPLANTNHYASIYNFSNLSLVWSETAFDGEAEVLDIEGYFIIVISPGSTERNGNVRFPCRIKSDLFENYSSVIWMIEIMYLCAN